MTSALKTGGIFSQNNSSVAFHFDPDKNVVKMISESSSVGKSEVEIPARISGPNQQLLLNYHYVLDCLNSINAETVILKVIDDNSPALIVPKEDFSYTYLVMPIKN
jgi:DNA polymerase-3 subunit beta